MKQESIRRNFVMNVLLSVSSFIFPLITFSYVSHILQPAGMGKVSLATSVAAYFSMFAQLGVPTYGIRACAIVREDRRTLSQTAHELLGLNLAMAIVSYALLALIATLVPRIREERALYLIVGTTVFLNSLGMEWLYKALEQYTYITVRSLAFKLVALAATFLLIHQESDYRMYGGISILASSASSLMNFIHARKYIDFPRPKDCDWRRHIKPVLVFFALSCAATVYTHLDELMLGLMTTDADVGYYQAATKVKVVLVGVVTALGAVMLPRSSYYVGQGQMEEFRRITEKAFRFVLMSASGLMLFFGLFARECVLVLSGEAYLEAVAPMRILMPTLLLIGLSNLLGIQILVPLGREKTVVISEIAGALVDLILNAILIPDYRSVGAAIGTLVAEAVVLGIQGYALRGEVRKTLRRYNWIRLLLALALAGGASFWLLYLSQSPLISLIQASVLFFGIFGAVLFIGGEETMKEACAQIRTKIRRFT